MSGHGRRQRILRSEAIIWRDKVIADVGNDEGFDAALALWIATPDVVIAAAELIAAHIAAGTDVVSDADLDAVRREPSALRRGMARGSRACRASGGRPDPASQAESGPITRSQK